ncbi:MAG: hypothetical protein JST30_15160 [Armatimonadetes bacterium]|nr:hypothetical protein [Armatimonadota bacterium]
MKRLLLGLLLTLAVFGCGGGGGGGGGGGSTTFTLQGRIIWIETGSATSPASTVQVGSQTTPTDDQGYFSLEVPAGTSSLTVTYQSIVRTFSFVTGTDTVDVGDLYIGPEQVTVQGRVTDASSGSPVSAAKVAIGGRQATTAANGTFSVLNVAYSSANTTVFLGLDGTVSASAYFERHFNPESLATGGVVQVGTISLTPLGSDTPPPPPYDVQGTVLPSDKGPGSVVEALQGAVVLRRVVADSQGKFTFWLPQGTFTIRATQGADTGQASVTVTDTSVIKNVNVTL